MNHDFLEGIDDQFQKLMRVHGNKKNGRSSRSVDDPILAEILENLYGLPRIQKEEVLAIVRALKQKAE